MEEAYPKWVIKELISVKYPQGDLVGMFFGYYSLLVYPIAPIYITLFLRNRDLYTFYYCFVHLISEIMACALKHILKHPRPRNSAPTGGVLEGKYGMPSQHCHCFSFIYFYLIWIVFHQYGRYISKGRKSLLLFIMTIALAIQVTGRIYLNFHTFNQCLCGVLFGGISASLFYFIGFNFIMPISNRLGSWNLCNRTPDAETKFCHEKIKSN